MKEQSLTKPCRETGGSQVLPKKILEHSPCGHRNSPSDLISNIPKKKRTDQRRNNPSNHYEA